MVLIYREGGSWCPVSADLTFAAAQHFTPSKWSGLHFAGNLVGFRIRLNFIEVGLHFICRKLY
jgi:hypothetical protein